MGTVTNFKEVRVTEGVVVITDTFAFIGQGCLRTAAYDKNVLHGINANHPAHLHTRTLGVEVNGVMRKRVKITRLKNTVGDWFSLRSSKGTVYLSGQGTVIVEGFSLSLSEFYSKVS
jgi:hypothetical protein